MIRNNLFAAIAAASISAILTPICASAAEISGEQAQTATAAWMRRGRELGKLGDRAVASSDMIEDAESGARLHVVKLEGGGFVVTSADDLVDPIIAFSPSGEDLEKDDRNPLWVLLRGDIAAREKVAGIARAPKSGAPEAAPAAPAATTADGDPTDAQRRWAELLADGARKDARAQSAPPQQAISDIRVDSFMPTRWNQSTHNNYTSGMNCYNYYTPNNYVCGCVATATAQIMRYYQHPTAPVQAGTYGCSVDGVSASYTMQGGTYDWGNMPLVPASGVTDAQCRAIGKLTYDIGVSVGMSWASGGSGASIYSARLRLLDRFGYADAEGVAFLPNNFAYSIDRVKDVVIPCCEYRTPVVMSVSGAGGHAVIVDGYGYSGSDFYMHVNCGWGGSNDAWYCPPDLTMGHYAFNVIDGFVFNVLPQDEGSIVSGRVLDAAGAPIANASVSVRSGSTTVAAATSDERGGYAVLVAPGDYVVRADSNGSSASLGITVVANHSKQMASNGGYYPQAGYAPTIGNTRDTNLEITGIESVAEPVISPNGGLFYPSTNVVITCATSGATIRYTLDGSIPTENSAAYSGPITISDDTTIKARAFKSGMNPSAAVGATFTYDAAQGAPKGDYYDNPIEISGASGSRVIDDNANYSIEVGEPQHTLQNNSYSYQYRTVWYRWTAPGTGTTTFTTKSSGGSLLIPTAIAVYPDSGTLPGSTATRIAMSKDYSSSGDYSTSLPLDVTQGTTYRIVGMQLYNQAGNFSLTWSGDLTVAQTETSETPAPVPYTWLDAYYPGQGTSADAYEELAMADTDGDGFAAWEEYVANTDPTDNGSFLHCEIAIGADDSPVITVIPATARENFPRIIQGRASLTEGDWGKTNSSSRFFRAIINY